MNKYQRQVPSTTIDIYDILNAWGVTCPATQHAIKKLLQPGERGHKDKLTDLREALASVERAIQIAENPSEKCTDTYIWKLVPEAPGSDIMVPRQVKAKLNHGGK